MSEQTTEAGQESFELGAEPQAQMADLFDFLTTGADPEETAEGDPAGEAPADESGQQPAATEGVDGVEQPAEVSADGAGEQQEPQAGGEPPATTAPVAGDSGSGGGTGTLDATSLNDTWGEVANAFETSQTELLHKGALDEVRNEYKPYFDRLTLHPRLLVGQEVQSLTGEGKETLRDAADAREWQSAAKHLLADEVQARVQDRKDQLSDVFTTVHSSIDLFRNNVDLIPGTKQFDRQLADRFAAMAKDYELRSDGKLVGYSVPVQPLINQLRSALAGSRASKTAQPTQAQQKAAQQPRNDAGQWRGPQAGISSKAGASGEAGEDIAGGVMDAFFRQNGFSL